MQMNEQEKKMGSSRPLKFRAWEHNLKEMIPVDDIQFYRGDNVKIDGIELKPKPRGEQPIMINTRSAWRIADGEDVSLMQFTGLHDKNGKEIYEFMEIDNKYRVIYIAPKYVLQDISTGDIIDMYEQREITGEYSPIS